MTAIAALALASAFASDWSLWQEYYGAGPPYYGRSTNMDKWTDPWPLFAVIDLVALMVVVVAALWLRRSGGDADRR